MRLEAKKEYNSLQTVKLDSWNDKIIIKLKAYWELTKGSQTLLLLITGWAGYASTRQLMTGLGTTIALLGSLFLAISGSTVLNMYVDRYIDEKMPRTVNRPLPAGTLLPIEVLAFGCLLSGIGIMWALALGPLVGLVVAAGVLFHAGVYSIWLKRKTPFSVVIGGVAGGMPVLAGRVLGTGSIDLIGILLALSVLLWIPIHIFTFAMRYADDYQTANIPTFPAVYGEEKTRLVLSVSTVLAGLAILLAINLIGVQGFYLVASLVAVGLLIILVVFCSVSPSQKRDFLLFKAASLYMLVSMVLVGLAK